MDALTELVAFFDFKDKAEAVIQHSLEAFHPITEQLGDKIAILFFKDELRKSLIFQNNLDFESQLLGKMYVPGTECWYAGNLSVATISKVVLLGLDRKIKQDPTSPYTFTDMVSEFSDENEYPIDEEKAKFFKSFLSSTSEEE